MWFSYEFTISGRAVEPLAVAQSVNDCQSSRAAWASMHPGPTFLGAQQMAQALKFALSAAKRSPIGDVLVDVIEPRLNAVDRLPEGQNSRISQRTSRSVCSRHRALNSASVGASNSGIFGLSLTSDP
ncbi:hypothetical protein [Burkholderia ambifaria]|uniref:hypothetical protein n=1 Tax=Burkholderia ambifaria TaxID=152480 RepID=UPI002FE1026A